MRTRRIRAQVITCELLCFSQRALNGVHSICNRRYVAVRWAYALPVGTLFVSSRSGIVFNPSACAITDHSQSTKDIDPYSNTQFYVVDSGYRMPVLILPNGMSKPGEREHDRNLISAVGGIRTHNLLIDSPAYHHWAITALNDLNISPNSLDLLNNW